MGVRCTGGCASASRRSSKARRAPCESERTSRPSTANTSKATNDAGELTASFATRDAAGCRRNCRASKSSPAGVAITISPSTTQPLGNACTSVVSSSGK